MILHHIKALSWKLLYAYTSNPLRSQHPSQLVGTIPKNGPSLLCVHVGWCCRQRSPPLVGTVFTALADADPYHHL